MTIHAVDKNMYVENYVINYRDRPEGSVSKLNTYSDGFKVLKTIGRLFRDYKPLLFFSAIFTLLLIIAVAFFIPILIEYIETGLVPNFPTLIVCGFVVIAALLSLFSGVILESIRHKNKQDFEMGLIELQHILNRLRNEQC